MIITISNLRKDVKEKIFDQCDQLDIRCKVFHPSFTDFEQSIEQDKHLIKLKSINVKAPALLSVVV